MNRISWQKAVGIFLVVFVLPAIAAQPFREDLMGIVQQPMVWQAVNSLLGAAIITGLAVYTWNQRKRIVELEREVERQKYREQQAITDGGEDRP